MLLIYSSPATWSALTYQEREQMAADHTALYQQLLASGEWVDGNALADPSRSHAVRVRAGAPMTTEGPYAETREHLAGYTLIDVTGPDRALQIAAQIPDARV